MIRVAGIYNDGDRTGTIPQNIFYCLGLLSLATAFETDGSASWKIAETLSENIAHKDTSTLALAYIAHAASLNNNNALDYITTYNRTSEHKKIEPSRDFQASVFAEIVKNRDSYTSKQLLNSLELYLKEQIALIRSL